MSKLKKSSIFRRFTAFLLSICSLISMLPTAMAADGDENLQYRYVWLISQPGIYLRFEPDGSVWVRDQDPAMKNKDYKMTRTTYEGEDVYLLLGEGHPTYTDPEGIGYIGLGTRFNEDTKPFVPNWPDADFEYVDGSATPFDKNAVTEENQDYTYWAGNIEGSSNQCFVYPGPDSWDKCTEEQPSTIDVIEFNRVDFSNDPNGGSIYYAQVRFLASDLQPYAATDDPFSDSFIEPKAGSVDPETNKAIKTYTRVVSGDTCTITYVYDDDTTRTETIERKIAISPERVNVDYEGVTE